jgi:hypothetical protein
MERGPGNALAVDLQTLFIVILPHDFRRTRKRKPLWSDYPYKGTLTEGEWKKAKGEKEIQASCRFKEITSTNFIELVIYQANDQESCTVVKVHNGERLNA